MTVCCLNPNCTKPENPDQTKFCQSCGNQIILLRNRYHPTKLLSNEGGFGRTYLAEDRDKFNSKCVIKQLFPQVSGSNTLNVLNALNKAKELFDREAGQLEKLTHPQIPSLFAYFQEGNELYLIQEFIDGQTLDKINRNWTEKEIRNFLNGILPVLQFIHDQNLIHRDLKPTNIMVRKPKPPFLQGLTEQYILIDFGASKDLAQTVATTGTRIGTFGYSPIEQLEGGEAYPCSDLYSIGVTCFYLLTGENIHKLFLDDGYNWVSNWQQYLKVNISAELRAILNKFLQKDRFNRYQSAEEVLKALNAPPITGKNINTGKIPPQKKSPQKSPVSPPQYNPPVPRRDVLKAIGYTSVGVIATVVGVNLMKNNPPQPSLEKGENPDPPQRGEIETFDLGNGVTLEMVRIPAGSFLMGSTDAEIERLIKEYDNDWFKNEAPQHQVTISQDFYLGKYQVTQAQWEAIMNSQPWQESDQKFWGDRKPVINVSWNDAKEFCQKLSQKTGKTFNLPSEAQWEYGCRAGSQTRYYFGDDESKLGDYAWYSENSNNQTQEVGKKIGNNFGLYDMMGNVWEWCEDHYHSNYDNAPNDGSSWVDNSEANVRILRGASWYVDGHYCRSSDRSSTLPSTTASISVFGLWCRQDFSPWLLCLLLLADVAKGDSIYFFDYILLLSYKVILIIDII
jgi:eukaryotic-like serine/threonine-protein kinase